MWRAGGGIGMHRVEHVTRVDADTLLVEFPVEAPTVWTRPWSAVIPRAASDGPMFE